MIRKTNSFYSVRHRSGFTLLELLLVVFILSLLALSAISLTDSLDSSQDQFRYEQARNQAAKFERGLIQRVVGQQSVSGFVSDMGGLPNNLLELSFGLKDNISSVTPFIPHQLILPVFDGTPDASTLYHDSEDVFIAGLPVTKGFRGSLISTGSVDFYAGSYLDLVSGSAVDYRTASKSTFGDGWGTTATNGFLNTVNAMGTITPTSRISSDHITVDDLTHGWAMDVFTSPDAFGNTSNGEGAHQIHLKTVGKDGLLNGTLGAGTDTYATDVPMLSTTTRNDWATDIADIHIEVVNDLPTSGNIVDAVPDGTSYAVRLLVCNAKTTTPLWRQYDSLSFNTIPANGTRSVSMINPAAGVTRLVPAGEHVLVLTRNTPLNPNFVDVDTPLGRTIELVNGNSENTTYEQQRLYVLALTGRNFRITLDSDDDQDLLDYANTSYQSCTLLDVDTVSERTALSAALKAGLEATIDTERGVSGTTLNVSCALAGNQLRIDITYQLPAGTPGQYANLPRARVEYSPPNYTTDQFQYRGQIVNVLPGQPNHLRLYLSSLFTFTP